MRNFSQNAYYSKEDENLEENNAAETAVNPEDGQDDTLDVKRDVTVEPNEIIRQDVIKELDEMDEKIRAQKQALPLPVDVASLEAFNIFSSGGEFLKKFADYLTGATNLIDDLKNKITNLLSSTNIGQGDYTKLLNHASQNQYFHISKKTMLYQPTRLSVDWLTYSQYLKTLLNVTSLIDRDVLAPVQEYLARAINDPALLASSSFKPKYTLKDTEAIQKEMGKIFNGPVVEKVIWSKAFKRNEDVSEFANNMVDIRRLCDTLKPTTVNKSVDVISNRVKTLSEHLKNPNGNYNLNPKHTKYLSDVVFVCAKYVELYAVVLQLVYELEQCVVVSSKKL